MKYIIVYVIIVLTSCSSKKRVYSYFNESRKEFYIDFERKVFIYIKHRPNMSIESAKIEVSEGEIIEIDEKNYVLLSNVRDDVTDMYLEYIMLNDTINKFSNSKIILNNNNNNMIVKGTKNINPYRGLEIENKVGVIFKP